MTSKNIYSQQILHSILSFGETPSLERNCLKVALTLSLDCLSPASKVISFFDSCSVVEADDRRPNMVYFLNATNNYDENTAKITFVYKLRITEHLTAC